jgi:translation elongation factor EF-Tu-like GTPase
MPGDNVEMVCDLVHDVAAEEGSRYVKPFYRKRSVADI